MTPETAVGKIRARAVAMHSDPEIPVLCVGAAAALAESLREGDAMIWPSDQGGLAWDVLGKGAPGSVGGKRESGGSGGRAPNRIFCVTLDGFPRSAGVWEALDRAAGKHGASIKRISIFLRPAPSAVREPSPPKAQERSSESPVVPDNGRLRTFLIGVLDGLREALAGKSGNGSPVNGKEPLPVEQNAPPATSVDPFAADGLFFALSADGGESVAMEPFPGSSPKGPGTRRKPGESLPEAYDDAGTDERPFHVVDSRGDLRDRYLAAMAASLAGYIPVVSVFDGEAAECPVHHARFAEKALPVVTRTAGDWAVARAVSADGRTAILTPASTADLAGALEWIHGNDGRILMVEPADGDWARSAMKAPWAEGEGVVVRSKMSGTAGRIAIVAPGPLMKESLKAAERLAKDNFSVTVHSLRFLAPLRKESLLELAEDHDILCLLDPDGGRSGRLSEAIEAFYHEEKVSLILPAGPHNGASIASAAASAHRENRFRMAVDDVKKDRWR